MFSPGRMTKTALLFAGQGAQVVGMGRDMFDQSALARDWFGKADEVLGCRLSDICFTGPETELTRTEFAQPAIYLVGWVAFQLLRERIPDLEFHATAGLSLGEFTALAAAGVVDFTDGIRVVRERGRFMQEACDVTKGGMAAILGLDEARVRQVCADVGVGVANLNCPGQIVLSGPADLMEKACEAAKAAGAKKAMPLKVAGAYHSPLMASAQPKLLQTLSVVKLNHASVPVLSNVTGLPHDESPDRIVVRLVEQVTASVRWEDSIRCLLAQGFTRFIELGPGKALTGFLRRIDETAVGISIPDMAGLDAAVKALAEPRPASA